MLQNAGLYAITANSVISQPVQTPVLPDEKAKMIEYKTVNHLAPFDFPTAWAEEDLRALNQMASQFNEEGEMSQQCLIILLKFTKDKPYWIKEMELWFSHLTPVFLPLREEARGKISLMLGNVSQVGANSQNLENLILCLKFWFVGEAIKALMANNPVNDFQRKLIEHSHTMFISEEFDLTAVTALGSLELEKLRRPRDSWFDNHTGQELSRHYHCYGKHQPNEYWWLNVWQTFFRPSVKAQGI